MKRLTPIFFAILLATVAITANPVFAHGQTTESSDSNAPVLKVEPQSYLAPKNSVGETFKINVTISNLDVSLKMIGTNFRLCYNTSLLEVVSVAEGPFLRDSRWNLHGTFFVNYVEDDPIYGPNVVVGDMLLPNATGHWTNFPGGSETVATITFREIYQPVELQPSASCTLELLDTLIVDSNGQRVSHNVENGFYEVQSLNFPTLSVEPPTYSATMVNEVFNVTVDINDLKAQWRALGVQFRLTYNAAMLEVTHVAEGPFLRDSRWNLYGTFFVNYVEDDPIYGPNVVVGDMLLPNATGGFDMTNFPEGNGTVAVITFRNVHGLPPHKSDLKLLDTLVFDYNGQRLSHDIQGGYYQMLVEKLSHRISWTDPETGEARISYVMTESNSTISPVPMTFVQQRNQLIFNVTGVDGNVGFCNITIPKEFLDEYFTVFIDDVRTNFVLTQNATHNSIYFTYTHSSHIVEIIATTVILKPRSGPMGTKVTVKGFGFSHNAKVSVTFDDALVGSTLTDENGTFVFVLSIPVSAPGTHLIKASDDSFHGDANFTVIDVTPLSVEMDVGTIHFRGELAEFYVQTSFKGTAVNVTHINALLYKPDGSTETLIVQQIATGFYKVSYTISGTASTGTYALVIKAEYVKGVVEANGTSFKCFLLSPTLTIENALITDINNDIATIVIPDLGAIQANLTAVNAKLSSINGTVALLKTDIGTVKTDISNIKLNITSINGRIATIETRWGTISVDISNIKGNQETFATYQYVAVALALIAALGATISVLLIRRKRIS